MFISGKDAKVFSASQQDFENVTNMRLKDKSSEEVLLGLNAQSLEIFRFVRSTWG